MDKKGIFVYGVLVGFTIMAAIGQLRVLSHLVAGLAAGIIAGGARRGALAGFLSGMTGEIIFWIIWARIYTGATIEIGLFDLRPDIVVGVIGSFLMLGSIGGVISLFSGIIGGLMRR